MLHLALEVVTQDRPRGAALVVTVDWEETTVVMEVKHLRQMTITSLDMDREVSRDARVALEIVGMVVHHYHYLKHLKPQLLVTLPLMHMPLVLLKWECQHSRHFEGLLWLLLHPPLFLKGRTMTTATCQRVGMWLLQLTTQKASHLNSAKIKDLI